MYEGDWVNNKAEGNGKYIWENGEYYIGQEKNGLKEGKGTMYYSNGNIKYDGDSINDKYEGNGKDNIIIIENNKFIYYKEEKIYFKKEPFNNLLYSLQKNYSELKMNFNKTLNNFFILEIYFTLIL